MPPEMRIGKISAHREVQINFTKPMNFPSTEKFIELNSRNQLLNLIMLSGDTDEVDKNLRSWKIF